MKTGNSGYAHVKVENENDTILVPISSDKPEIPDSIQDKWQKIVDVTARILRVPSGLITRLTNENLEIFVASHTEGNPYKQNDSDRLGIGMFCETVAGLQKPMTVQNIADIPYWEGNPHAKTGMKSYSGVPILWEDGEVFGTFCMLTDKPNRFSDDYRELIFRFREIIENDLHHILIANELQKKVNTLDLQIREAHHRIKNHFNMLISFIQLQAGDSVRENNQILIDLQSRIHALSLIHERLYKTRDSGLLPLDVYLKDLTRIILEDFNGKKVSTDMEIEQLQLTLDSCVSIGLIFSELISNSIKYAFPDNSSPAITVSVKQNSRGNLELLYRDNGGGYPEDTACCPDSLGLYLIKMLCDKMGGTPDFVSNRGAQFSTVIPVKKLQSIAG